MSENAPIPSPLGLCLLPDPPQNAARTVCNAAYVHEILDHAGLPYTPLSLTDLPNRLPSLRLLLTVGEATLPEETRRQLEAWVQAGGAWLSVGGVCGAGNLFGVEAEVPAYSSWGGGSSTLGEGYLEPTERSNSVLTPLSSPWYARRNAVEGSCHPILTPLSSPLHYFNGIPVRATQATVLAHVLDAHQRTTPRAAVTEHPVGSGRCFLIAPDVTGTVVRIQQGIAITRDGVSAPDGTAPISDGVLKSGDGGVLDWLFDRQDVPGVPGLKAFLEPIADQWRELLLRAIFHLAAETETVLPLLWLYPRCLPAVGHISHDTDGNEPERARELLDVLKSADIRSTWCVILPGYEADLMAAVRAAGHEFATHFDAMSDGTVWEETALDAQWQELTALFGERPTTNKNHYLRWEGDTEFFDWCARRGIRLDQSKGASKTGEAGFNFGTCHLFFPLAPDGRRIDVQEMPTPTQDLIVFAPEIVGAHLLEAVERHHGILHLLFHPGHIYKPGVADALRNIVAKAQERGLEWWTARQIDTWERARRQVQWSAYDRAEAATSIRLHADDALPGATLLWLTPHSGNITVNGATVATETVERWGFRFQSAVFDVQPGNDYHIAFARP